mgnify:FL=1
MPTNQGHPVVHPVVHPPLPEREWHSLKEAVALGYGGYSTLRNYIAQGRLRAYKIGGLVKVRREDLDALVEPARPEPTFEDVEAAVERIVASAPPLTDEQCRRLAAVFGGVA